MRTVLIGPPGAGKGTQAKALERHLRVPHVSTGEMLRDAKRSGTPLGRQIGIMIDRGDFAPDEVVLEFIQERLRQPDCRDGWLLDGFPRTLHQAESFDESLSEVALDIDYVIQLEVDESELCRRMTRRYESSVEPRPEDHPDRIPRRIENYYSLSAPLIDYYRQHQKIHVVDGTGMPGDVFQRILCHLESAP